MLQNALGDDRRRTPLARPDGRTVPPLRRGTTPFGYPFTEPARRPLTKKRCKARKTTTGRTIETNPAAVNSPTFVLIQEYAGRLPIYHFDAYRLRSVREFAELGGQQLMTEPYTTLDLGMRYRFKAFGDKPATLRAIVTNVTDEFAWQTSTAGSFSVSSPRAFQVSLAVDF